MTVFLDQVASLPATDVASPSGHGTSDVTSAGASSQKGGSNVGSEEGIKELCWDLIKRFGTLRMKIYNLQKAWQKFWVEDKNKKV